MAYPIPSAPAETLLEVKKSRFISRAAMVPDRATAMALLAQARSDYPDARHHCWAYLLGSPHQPSSVAMSDDGEPSGTAGKPILNVLQHSAIGDVMVVVIRYFGGIKLGAGGLVRAYSAASQQVIDALPTVQQVPRLRGQICCDFSQEHYLRHWLTGHDAHVGEVVYGAGVALTVELPEAALTALKAEALAQNWQLSLP